MTKVIISTAERLQNMSSAFATLLKRFPSRNEAKLYSEAEVHEAMEHAYRLGCNEGLLNYQAKRSNLIDTPLSKQEQSAALAKATEGKRPSNIPDVDLDLEDLGL